MITKKTVYEGDSTIITKTGNQVEITDDHGDLLALYVRGSLGDKWELANGRYKDVDLPFFRTFKELGQFYLGEEFLS